MLASSRRSLSITVLGAFFLLAIVVTAGTIIRGYVSAGFDLSQQIESVRLLAQNALRLQLDAETGVRGLAATGNATFLEPYREAEASLGATFDRLQSTLACCGLAEAAPFVADARRTEEQWNVKVARPILEQPFANAERIQLYGKQLVDRYRSDFARIDGILDRRERSVAAETRIAIDRINLFVAALVVLLALAILAYGVEQLRTAARLRERERVAEDERRQRAELRAAYETEKRIADTLQEAFTQRPLPELETLHFSASYVAATEDARVGGDWYDAISLGASKVFFAIGDVTGHGIEAAVTMNRTRQSIVSAALVDSDPAALLDRVNADVSRNDSRLVTAIVGLADAENFEFCYAVAGHPPPVLLEPGRAPRFLECGSLPLGASEGESYLARRVQSVPGAVLVLYTDGAVEHSHDVLEGEQVLLEAIARAAEHPESEPAPFIHQAIFAGRTVSDDVAILTIGFKGEKALGSSHSRDWSNLRQAS